MNDREKPPSAAPDRRLGDEWEDWDGSARSQDTQAPLEVFAGLAGGVVLGWTAIVAAAAWLIWPRVRSLGLEWAAGSAVGAALVWLWFWYACLWLATWSQPWARKVVVRLGGIRWAIGPATWLGRRLGINRDRVGHAFVLLHNRLEVLPPLVGDPSRLLVVIPRCLDRATLQALAGLKERYGFSQVTAVGGTEARRAIAQQRPQGIVAVACERDLLSGVKDVKGRVPVLAFSNRRPEGPCKNTVVDLAAVEQGVRRFLGIKPLAETKDNTNPSADGK